FCSYRRLRLRCTLIARMASSTTVVQARKRVRDEEARRPSAGAGRSPPLILRSRGHPGSLLGVARVAHDVFSSSFDAPRRTGTSQAPWPARVLSAAVYGDGPFRFAARSAGHALRPQREEDQ